MNIHHKKLLLFPTAVHTVLLICSRRYSTRPEKGPVQVICGGYETDDFTQTLRAIEQSLIHPIPENVFSCIHKGMTAPGGH
jgi:hypothetical protein